MLDFGFYNMDCMDGMKEFPDNFFDLAVVDPPYGDAAQNEGGGTGTGSARGSTGTRRHYQHNNVRKADGSWGVANWRRMGEEARSDKKIISWDVSPGKDYFEELFRVSRNQIIWGGELLRITADAVLPRVAEAVNLRKLHDGHGGICVDQLQRQLEGVRVHAARTRRQVPPDSEAGRPLRVDFGTLHEARRDHTRHARRKRFLAHRVPEYGPQVRRFRDRPGLLQESEKAVGRGGGADEHLRFHRGRRVNA